MDTESFGPLYTIDELILLRNKKAWCIVQKAVYCEFLDDFIYFVISESPKYNGTWLEEREIAF